MVMETYIGSIRTAQDALIVFEACRQGLLQRVQRRLSSKERACIVPGSIFVWDEREAGMRRWTDGRAWSPSRVSGSFLTYRELSTSRRPRRTNSKSAPVYSYKPNGLIKQSFSICTANNQKLHLISYFTKEAVQSKQLVQPCNDSALSCIVVPKGFYPEMHSLDINNSTSTSTRMSISSTSTTTSCGGGHPVAVDTMTPRLRHVRDPSPILPPSLSASPVSSDDEMLFSSGSSESVSPVMHFVPRPSFKMPGFTLPVLGPLDGPFTTAYTVSAEDKRQLKALECQLRL